MRQLGREGYDVVVDAGSGQREAAELAGRQELLQALEKVGALEVGHLGRDDHHGGALEHGGAGVREARVLGSRHGVASHEGPAVALRDFVAGLADDALDAHRVYDDGAIGDETGLLAQPVDGGLGVARKDDELAGAYDVVGELAGHSLDLCKLERAARAVPGKDLAAGGPEGAGEGASHEAQAHDTAASGHKGGGAALLGHGYSSSGRSAQTASRMRAMRRMTSSNCAGVSAWAPSDHAWDGLLWTSISRPSAPAAQAAYAAGRT